MLISAAFCIRTASEEQWISITAWLSKHRPHLDIIGKAKEVYLKRVWLLGHRTSKWALMIHQMNTPDQDRVPHDHPWSFLTLILWGGYVEETPNGRRYLKPWSIHYRPATYIHRIAELPRDRAFTLVFRWRYVRSWGFWDNGKWYYWKNFLKLDPEPTVVHCGPVPGVIFVNGSQEDVPMDQYEATVQFCNTWNKKWFVGGSISPFDNSASPYRYYVIKDGILHRNVSKEVYDAS